jgi:hypothetical protein
VRPLVRARPLFERAVALQREIGDPQMLANFLSNLGDAARELSDLDAAAMSYAESLTLAEEVDELWLIAYLLEDVAMLAASRARPPPRCAWPRRARDCGTRSVRRYRGRVRNGWTTGLQRPAPPSPTPKPPQRRLPAPSCRSPARSAPRTKYLAVHPGTRRQGTSS